MRIYSLTFELATYAGVYCPLNVVTIRRVLRIHVRKEKIAWGSIVYNEFQYSCKRMLLSFTHHCMHFLNKSELKLKTKISPSMKLSNWEIIDKWRRINSGSQRNLKIMRVIWHSFTFPKESRNLKEKHSKYKAVRLRNCRQMKN